MSETGKLRQEIAELRARLGAIRDIWALSLGHPATLKEVREVVEDVSDSLHLEEELDVDRFIGALDLSKPFVPEEDDEEEEPND